MTGRDDLSVVMFGRDEYNTVEPRILTSSGYGALEL
jgi:hypothetical protein